VKIAWTDATGGSPNEPVDPTQLTGIQWQFTIPTTGTSCDADITIKNVKFFN